MPFRSPQFLVLIATLTWLALVVPSRSARAAGIEEVVVEADAPVVTADHDADVSSLESADDEEPSSASDADDAQLKALRKERDMISAENALAQEKLRRELFPLEAEQKQLALENSLRSARFTAKEAELKSKIDEMSLQMETLTKEAALEAAQRRVALDKELADLRAQEERLKLTNSIASQKLEGQLAQMRVKESEFKIQKAELEMEVARLQTELQRREKVEVLHDIVPDEQPKYTEHPYNDGVLLISDRRIALNGVILPSTADRVAERIDYYNNQNTAYPIFIVIDSSPGGTVMAGYKILKAMEGSQAPVVVVVKSFAASMAATIATLARQSYAYPNAVILHHQIAWLGGGNLTQQRELLEDAQQWWRRLAQPIAAKMGLSLDEFIKRMYEANSDGDWREFGDEAVKLHWIDAVVNTIWETSMDKNPDRFGTQPVLRAQLQEKTDEAGNPYTVLPRLGPFDYYYIYNRDGYFRLR